MHTRRNTERNSDPERELDGNRSGIEIPERSQISQAFHEPTFPVFNVLYCIVFNVLTHYILLLYG